MAPIRVAIVGGGISGITQAIRLKEELGSRVDFTIFERASAPGGVWRDSTWPGSGVDVPIHFYSLYSEPHYDWKELYATQPEVLEYWNGLIKKHGLADSFRYSSEYIGSTWSEVDQSHTLTLRRPDGTTYTHTADVLISANGPLSTPTLPKLPGLSSFKGIAFHNLRWRSDVDFVNQRVAVVGNGSSAIQFIPGLAAIPGVKLTQFIRSGGYFVPKVNTTYSPVIKFLFRWIPGAHTIYRFSLFLKSDDWWQSRNAMGEDPSPKAVALLKYLADQAPPQYLDKLSPKFPLGCQRPAYDMGWLKSLHRENVDLVNEKLVAVDEEGLVTEDGTHHQFDIIIFATGSNVAEHGLGLSVGLKGEGGVELRDHWKSTGGPRAYLGCVPGFPNHLTILGPNAVSVSFAYTIGIRTAFNARLVKGMVENGVSSVQPKHESLERYNKEIQEELQATSMNSNLCTSWWRVGGQGLNSVASPFGGFAYERLHRRIRWRDWNAVGRLSSEKGSVLVPIDVEGKIGRHRLITAVKLAVPLLLAILLRVTRKGQELAAAVWGPVVEALRRASKW